MMLTAVLIAVAVSAILLLLLVSGLGLRLAADLPNARSLHTKITPRIGGLVLVPVATLAAVYRYPHDWLLPSLALGLWAISFADDRYGLPILLRFLTHFAVAAILVFSSGSMSLGVACVWICLLVWITNLYNFMDGSDGLAGGMGVIGFGIYALVAWPQFPAIAALAILIAIAAASFLLFNFPPARVFMGDAGSIPLGFLAGALGFLGWQAQAWPWWFPLIVFSPFILDASMTLLRRMLRGQKFWQAHKEHYYQRLIQMGWSHRRLALTEYGLMLVAGGFALQGRTLSSRGQIYLFILLLLCYTGLMLVVDKRWRKFTESKS